MKRIFGIMIMIIFGNFKAMALDNEVTILAVYTTTTATETARVGLALGYAQSVWNNLGISTPIQFANNAIPVALNSSLGGASSDMSTQINQAYALAQIATLRSNYKADVVLIFSAGSTAKCGVTAQYNWNFGSGNFIPNLDLLDLRGKDNSYISIVNMDCDDPNNTTSHELGHIFGADHLTDPGLYSDSLGFRRTYYKNVGKPNEPEVLAIQDSSPMATPAQGVCSADICSNVKYYSTAQYANYGDSAHNNRRAISTTARSVANYQQGAIVLKKPIALTGFIVNACTENGNTEHRIFWTEGGSNVLISHYQLWAMQGSEYYYTYRWDVVGLSQTTAFVRGSSAYVKVKACFGHLCSALSDSFYVAQDMCNSVVGTDAESSFNSKPTFNPK